jgi:hypothetical protein
MALVSFMYLLSDNQCKHTYMLKKKDKKKKQESHDSPEIAHLYVGPQGGPILNQGLLFEQPL